MKVIKLCFSQGYLFDFILIIFHFDGFEVGVLGFGSHVRFFRFVFYVDGVWGSRCGGFCLFWAVGS